MELRTCTQCQTDRELNDFPKVGAGRRHICVACFSPPIRRCKKCGEDKPVESFSRAGAGRRGDCKACRRDYTNKWTVDNRDRVRASNQAWRDANPDRIAAMAERRRPKAKTARRARTVARYGLSVEQYDAMLAAQSGACAICLRPERGGKALATDHCHETGAVRGLLCQNCNNGLGRFRDDAELLRRAIAYVGAA